MDSSKRLGIAALATALLAAPGGLSAEEGFPKLNPFSSTEQSVAYGLTAGCLPYLTAGGSIHERIGRSSRRISVNGRPAYALFGRGLAVIQEDGRGGCDLTVRWADPERLREAVLETLRRAGAGPTPRFDSGAGSRDSVGSFRQEAWCFTHDGRQAGLVMSTSSERRRPALQASLFVDRDGLCAERTK